MLKINKSAWLGLLALGVSVAHAQQLSADTLSGLIARPVGNAANHVIEERGFFLNDETTLSGTIGLTDYIKASNTDAGDQFGFYVDISGDLLVVGAPFEDSNGIGEGGNPSGNALTDSGAAYVYRKGPGGWAFEAMLKASNADAGDNFGTGVAIEGDLVVVGAEMEDSNTTGVNSTPNNAAENSGAAYIFRYSDGVWEEEAYLKASNTGIADFFGSDVDISNETVVVSAPFEDSSSNGINSVPDNFSTQAGAAYVFVKTADGWVEEAYVKASNSDIDDRFSQTVSIDGNTMVIGAPREDSASAVINGSQGNSTGDRTGNFGAAYVFVRNNDVWEQQAYLKAPNVGMNDLFGISSAVSGDTVAVGAIFEDSSSTGVNGPFFDNAASDSGAVYVFKRNDAGVWFFNGYLKSENTGSGDRFGELVGISDNTIIAGAIFEDSREILPGGMDNNDITNSGAAYVYQIDGNDITLVSSLKSNPLDINDELGFGLAISGKSIAVGARLEDSESTGVNGNRDNNNAPDAGAVYLFNNVTSFHPLSGRVIGLAEGNSVTLVNNDSDIITIDENGSFRFPGLFATGESFSVTVVDDGQPENPHQLCELSRASGVISAETVGTLLVECTLHTLSINTNINTVNQAVVSVPVQLAPEGLPISGVSFRLDYDEQCLNPDANSDGVLDQIAFDVGDEFTTFVDFDPARNDGEIGIIVGDVNVPISTLAASNLVSIDFLVDCPAVQAGSSLSSALVLNGSTPPTFSSPTAEELEGTVNDGEATIWASFAGDCNASGSDVLSVADLTSLALEIADDDGTNYLDAPESDNFGSPQGCDANGNLQINVADISCIANLLFGAECEPLRTEPITKPELNISTRFEDDIVWLQTRVFQNGNGITAVSYDLVLDSSVFDSRTVDYDNNGLPDRIQLLTSANHLARWNANEKKLRVVLYNIDEQSALPKPFAEELLIEIGIPRTALSKTGFLIAPQPGVVFADDLGNEIEGVSSVGDVIFQDTFE